MKTMSYNVIAVAAVAVLALCTLAMGCQSCYRAGSGASGLRKSKGVPAEIADAGLLRYNYTRQGTMRWPDHSESVEICPDDSTRCIIRLFDQSRITDDSFDANGDPMPDTLVAGREVLDSVRQMIIDARAWQFKDDYSPRSQAMDGYSWGFTATFAATDSMLAAAPEARRPRLLRNGGCTLSSGGSNAAPDTRLFEQVRLYLQGVYEASAPRQ